MTFFIELNGPFLWKPGYMRSRHMTRFWWGFIAFGWLPCDLKEHGRKHDRGEIAWFVNCRGHIHVG